MNSLLLPILIPFSAAVLCIFLQKSLKAQRTISLIAAVLHLITSFQLLENVRSEGVQVYLNGSWPANLGIALTADLLSCIMLQATAFISMLVLIYSFKEMSDDYQSRAYFPLFNFLMMGVNGSFITGDIFNMYVWFEVRRLGSFILLTLGRKPDQLEGAIKYVTINLFSSALFLAGAAIVYAKSGTLNMADVAMRLSSDVDGKLINSTGILFLCSFGIKSALFPFFLWLPASYHTPPVSISALFAGLLTKVGIYAVIRFFSLIFIHQRQVFQGIFFCIAIFTMVVGVLCAASQYEIRKILSVHIVSQIGYMILGLCLFTPLGIAGALFYILHNIIVKTNLFLFSGVIMRLKGTCELKQIGGLYKAYPFFSCLFAFSAFALAGVPPLSGFWAKFFVLKAAADVQQYILLGTGLAVGLVTLFSMTKIWSEAFWKKQPKIKSTQGDKPEEAFHYLLLLPIGLLTLSTILMGFYAENLILLCQQAAEQLLAPDEYIKAVMEAGKQ